MRVAGLTTDLSKFACIATSQRRFCSAVISANVFAGFDGGDAIAPEGRFEGVTGSICVGPASAVGGSLAMSMTSGLLVEDAAISVA